MNRTFLVLGVLAAFAFGSAMVAAASKSAGVERAAPAKRCAPGAVDGFIAGSRRCLRAGQRCSRRHDRQYHRYRFHCHSTRLVRFRKQVPAPPRSGRSGPVVMAAGDIACEPGSTVRSTECRHRQTSDLLMRERKLTRVLTLGDHQYEDGRYEEFVGKNAYAATWGRKRSITKPAPGNHDYHDSGAPGYFRYFGAAAGDADKGYYSFDIGSWHLVALNSEIPHGSTSEQVAWLRRDLAATRKRCILAYWHKPRFSSGDHGGSSSPAALWNALYAVGADVVLNAHDHDYERFAPQNPSGQADTRGIRQFVVGTGGASHYAFGSTAEPNSEVRDATTFGVLKLTLRAAGYDWRFVPEAGRSFTDSGSAGCH